MEYCFFNICRSGVLTAIFGWCMAGATCKTCLQRICDLIWCNTKPTTQGQKATRLQHDYVERGSKRIIKGSKECCLRGQNTACKFSEQSPLSGYKTTLPFIRLQNDTPLYQATKRHSPLSGYKTTLPFIRLQNDTPLYQATKRHSPLSGCKTTLPFIRLQNDTPLYQATKRHSPLSGYKTTLKQQLNGEKR